MAQAHGFEMVNQNDQLVQVQKKVIDDGEKWKDLELMDFKIIKRLEFNSDRKRMSILVEDVQDGHFKLYIKGADNVILSRLNPSKADQKKIESTKDFLQKASMQGFRTLLIGMKIYDKE